MRCIVYNIQMTYCK